MLRSPSSGYLVQISPKGSIVQVSLEQAFAIHSLNERVPLGAVVTVLR